MPFAYSRTIRLADTDAAGVVYFARTLSLCHEAYEEALSNAGIPLGELLGGAGIVVPIARSEAEYLRPLRPGDKIRISVTPEPRHGSARSMSARRQPNANARPCPAISRRG
jgi:1,4-dihydroxy-2-naphthoyl-CoA hydrolase